MNRRWTRRNCDSCGNEFQPNSGAQKFCVACRDSARKATNQRFRDSKPDVIRDIHRRANVKYQEAHPERVSNLRSDINHRRRGAFVESVDRWQVYNRDGGICGICGQPVDWEDFSLDHIVPLSKGGEHSYGNVRTTHLRCNQRRGNRVAGDIDSHQRQDTVQTL